MIKENVVYIKKIKEENYPNKSLYNPPNNFPEYPFKEDKLDSENIIYREIRKLLLEVNLDRDNFNTMEWNPFGEFVNPGEIVVLKPNMVMHKNGNN